MFDKQQSCFRVFSLSKKKLECNIINFYSITSTVIFLTSEELKKKTKK